MYRKSIRVIRKDGVREFFRKSWTFLKRNLSQKKLKCEKKLSSISVFDSLFFYLSKRRLDLVESGIETEDIIHTIENYNGFGYYRSIEPAQVTEEYRKMLELLEGEDIDIIMEIGTMDGGTLYGWSQKLNPEIAISLDLPEGEFGGGYPSEKSKLYHEFNGDTSFRLLRENSHEELTKKKVAKVLGNKEIDFLFIDGDHTYEGVKQDFEMYSEFVKNGGIIAFHDICEHPDKPECNVDSYWNEIKEDFEHVEIIGDKNQGWAGIGVIYLE